MKLEIDKYKIVIFLLYAGNSICKSNIFRDTRAPQTVQHQTMPGNPLAPLFLYQNQAPLTHYCRKC